MNKSSLRLLIMLLVSVVTLGVPVILSAQDSAEDLLFDFTIYEGNPVLPRGEEGEWDAGFTFMGNVLYEDGMFHMFYIGGEGDFNESTLALGYASSEDGLHWTKYVDNPLLPLDGNADLQSVFAAVPFHDGDTWVLLLTPHVGRAHPDTFILRATAPDPTGPWNVSDTPLLEGGGRSAWDTVISPDSIVSTADGYTLYYWALHSSTLIAVGRATSPDGETWTKHNDPDSDSDRLFEDSDPVLAAGEIGRWDDTFIASADVLLGDHGWEVFYTAGPDHVTPWAIGYATSGDGLNWERYGDTPILSLDDDLTAWTSSVVVVEDTYYLYYSPFIDVGPITGGVGHYPEICVATGTITRSEDDDG